MRCRCGQETRDTDPRARRNSTVEWGFGGSMVGKNDVFVGQELLLDRLTAEWKGIRGMCSMATAEP
jgi:hypothetical protein